MTYADRCEARRFCSIGKGGLGGILGGLAGGALDFAAPELGVPLALATGGGSFLGSTAQGLASGEPFGKAALGGLESGAITAGLTGLGEGLTTGDVFAAPGAAATGPLGSLFGATPGAADVVGAAPVTPVTETPLTAGVASAPALTPAAAAGGAPAAGTGVGAPVAGIAGTTGAAPGDVTGALSAPPTLTQGIGTAGPTSGGALSSDPGVFYTPGTAQPLTTGGTADLGNAAAPESFGSKLISYIGQNPGLLLAGGGLTEALLRGNAPIPGLDALKSQAALEAAQGNQNLTALQTGQLPQGAQAAIDQAQEAAKATTASEFARLGMTGSTSEAQAIAGIEQASAAQKFKDLMDVANLGLGEVGGANSLYTQIMQTQLAQDQATQDAIARLSAALAGSTGAVRTATGTSATA